MLLVVGAEYRNSGNGNAGRGHLGRCLRHAHNVGLPLMFDHK